MYMLLFLIKDRLAYECTGFNLPPGRDVSPQAHALLTAPERASRWKKCDPRVRNTLLEEAPPTLRDVLRAGRLFGGRDFLVYENERVTFEALWRASGAVAHLCRQRSAKGRPRAIVMRISRSGPQFSMVRRVAAQS